MTQSTPLSSANPLVLVGLPRSGSTLLSRLLNESPDGVMVNDFYLLQTIESCGGFSVMTQESRRTMLRFVAEQVRNRTQPEDAQDEVWFGLPLDREQLDLIDGFVASYEADEDESWGTTLQNVMHFVGGLVGRPQWGWNTPQDYLLADEIRSAYPSARFLFLLRSPSKTLLSYKYYWTVVDKFEGDRGRYHPILQSLAWRSCASAYLEMVERLGPEQCDLVTMEELLEDTATTLKKVEAFSGWDLPIVDPDEFGHNSSLSSKTGGDRKLSGLEMAICRRITAKTQRRLGFEPEPPAKWRLSEVGELATTTVRSGLYYGRAVIFSTNSRRRVGRFARAQLRR